MYAAAARWRDEGLIGDRSLVAARHIDASLAVRELRRDFIAAPDLSSGTFLTKLRAQLEHSSTDTVAVAADLLYVHNLIVATDAKTKIKSVNDVLSFRDRELPQLTPELAEALRGGAVRPGQAYNNYRWKMFAYLIEVYAVIKSLDAGERARILRDYDEFERVVSGVDDQTAWSQRYALEHLLFPDVVPPVVSRSDRRSIVHSFTNLEAPDLVPGATLATIVRQLEPNMHYGQRSGVNLYRTPLRERWKPESNALKVFTKWTTKIIETVGLDEQGRKDKLERVPALRDVIVGAAAGADLVPLVTAALRGFGAVDDRVADDFIAWVGEHPEAAASALREIGIEPGPEAIDRFLAHVPEGEFPGLTARLNLASALLFGQRPKEYPPWRGSVAQALIRLTDGVRAQESATTGEHYVLFLERLDVILLQLQNRAELRDRLDAQGLDWVLAKTSSFPEWSDADNEAFALWQSGKAADAAPAVHEAGSSADAQPTVADSQTTQSLEDLAAQLNLDDEGRAWLNETITLLQHRKQLILQGPPGTGKTFFARAIAQFIAGDPDRTTLVQFHPSTSYEDFVQGLRPDPSNPGRFDLKAGPLPKLAKQALQHPEQSFVLIIDELNRANVPAAFGELYFLIEYRDHEATLLYGETLRLPPNLFLIATMNTADRSITALDSALRRRFYVRDLRPGEVPMDGVLKNYLDTKDPDQAWLADLLDHANSLLPDPEQAVGPSHFMGQVVGEQWARRAWDNTVLPTLREVYFNRPDLIEQLEFDLLKAHVTGSLDDETAD
jgi:hypothetical protein